ncbi:MAG TPA: helix-turn-helix domain-containing protein [Amycolatopsis sp.]|nr:helix-turn-helix domain-containing protein [Amycolatopsis sp.]
MTGEAAAEAGYDDVAVGPRVRQLRTRRGLSLRALAATLGISPSALSQIETGRTRPSIKRVHQIATVLEIPLSTLFAPQTDLSPRERTAPGENPTTTVGYDASICVQRAAETPSIGLDNGIRWERISPREAGGLAFLHLVFEPGAGYSEYLQHNGREIVYLLEGALTFHIGFATHEINAGDSFMFPSTTPHKVVNPNADTARACWLVLS